VKIKPFKKCDDLRYEVRSNVESDSYCLTPVISAESSENASEMYRRVTVGLGDKGSDEIITYQNR
jgi:hypothetical protein